MKIEQQIKHAIQNHLQLKFTYDGHERTVNPHHLGILGGELQIHAYQVHDGSHSGADRGWKNFHVSQIENLKELTMSFIPEESYHPSNSRYTEIFIQV